MKREGRQHGMVRTYRVLEPPMNPRLGLNPLTAPSTAGLFTKVTSKPTNHSKFTGKCGQTRCLGCHLHPTTKAKVKTKGELKLRSYDSSSAYKMLMWRVAGEQSHLNFSGVSATGILDLMSEDMYVEDYDDAHHYDHDHEHGEETTKMNGDAGENDCGNEDGGPHDGDDDEKMGICNVGIMIEHADETPEEGVGWCLVEEMMILDP